MDFKILAVTEETENYKKAKNKFVTVNCDDTMLFWYTNENVSSLTNWYNSEDFDGPCNDDLVLYLEIEEGHKLFDYKDRYLKDQLGCIPHFDNIPAIWHICSIMQAVGYNERINEEEQAAYEHERNTRFDINESSQEELPDEEERWELIFTDTNGTERKYFDINNFLSDYAEGRYMYDLISNVTLNGFEQDFRLDIISMNKLAHMLNVEKRYDFSEIEKNIAKVDWENSTENPDSPMYCPDDYIADINGYTPVESNGEDVRNTKRALHHEGAMAVLVSAMPKDFSEFNSETGFGEPQHWMDLPNGRSLEITYEDTGDNNRYYSWRIHCSSDEFDTGLVDNQGGIIAEETSDNFEYDAVYTRIEWAIEQALSIPIFKKPEYSFKMGEEVCLKFEEDTTYNGYVIDYVEDSFLTIVFPDKRDIIKYTPERFEDIFEAKTGLCNDLVNALF